jgi:hypothetical protein
VFAVSSVWYAALTAVEVSVLGPAALDRPHRRASARSRSFSPATKSSFGSRGMPRKEIHRMWLDDPVNSTLLEPWLPLFDGPLHRAPEILSWEIG